MNIVLTSDFKIAQQEQENVTTYDLSYEGTKTKITNGNQVFEINLEGIAELKVESIRYTFLESGYLNNTYGKYIINNTAPVSIRYCQNTNKIAVTIYFANTLLKYMDEKELTQEIDVDDFVIDIFIDCLSGRAKTIIDGTLKCIDTAINNIFKKIDKMDLLDVFTYKEQKPAILRLVNPENEIVGLAQLDYSKDSVPIIQIYSYFSFTKVSNLQCITPFYKYGITVSNVENIGKYAFLGLMNIESVNKFNEPLSSFEKINLFGNTDQLSQKYTLKTETITKKSKLLKIGL